MAALTWDGSGERKFETGISHGVIYPQNTDGTYSTGVAWNGLTSVSETPDGGETTDLYADNIKYASMLSTETFGGTVEAYTYPEEFEACDGSTSVATGVTIGQQGRQAFGLSYQTAIGSDTISDFNTAYKIHIVYGCKVSPSERSYETINDSPDAITFSWELSSTPVNVTGYSSTSLVTIDSTKCDPDKLATLEEKLYGSDTTDPTLLLPDEIIEIFA